ncbi:MAG TPA: peptidylprolyl isomerase [Thermoanaerobaculia bacterium]|jgi:cyclophilin family peptidyl-prolyl cis-trans isomerase|nr:peptidylprolyl isomerase [Thermoanaerobaculia bacterium]
MIISRKSQAFAIWTLGSLGALWALVALAAFTTPALAAAPAAVTGAAPAADRAALLDPGAALWQRQAPAVFQARFETGRGPFVVEVRRDWAPHGADRFFGLIAAGFFDDSRFFRVVAGYIAQFGVAGDPAVTAAWKDRPIPDDPVRHGNARGTLAFAMTGPGTRLTQLYINLADNARLDPQGFAPIGRVVAGMEIVDSLYAAYGERSGGGMRAGHQGQLLAGGNLWLDAEYPQLDRLWRVRLVEPR